MKIQWNKVTWYSKAIALVLFVVLPFVGFWLGINYGKAVEYLAQMPASATSTSSSATTGVGANGLIPYYNDPSEWQTDSNNTSGGFSIAYPLDFDTQDNYAPAPSTDWRLDSNGTPGIEYFTLSVPRAFEPQTNFVETTLTVGASANDTAVAQCMTPDPDAGPEAAATSSAMINGIAFTVFHTNGAAAGNEYDTTSYRTLYAGECYAVEYTVHSGQILNYPSSYNLQPFDEAKIDALIQNIIGTFKFM